MSAVQKCLQVLSSTELLYKKNYSLCEIMAYRIGGPADVLVLPRSEPDILKVLELINEHNLSLHIVGSGTNLLIRDGGLEGITLFMGPYLAQEPKIVEEDERHCTVEVWAAYPKASLADWALSRSLGGLAFSAGIPGTMGGAVYMNAGTKWGSYADVIEKISCCSFEKGQFFKSRSELNFQYRGHGGDFADSKVVLSKVWLKLEKLAEPSSIAKQMDEILAYRGLRQALELPSCGSVFKNPPNSERGAGRLIEASGLKGARVGQAQVSNKHANFILNLGGARSADVEGLIKLIVDKVYKDHAILLEPELVVKGRG